MYGSNVWHSTSKYRRTIWQCNGKFKNEQKCSTPHLTEDILKKAFIEVYNDIIKDKDEIVGFIEDTISQLSDTASLDRKINEAAEKLERKSRVLAEYIKLNSRMAISQEEYQMNFDAFSAEYDNANDALNMLQKKKTEIIDRKKRSKAFLENLKEQDLITEFSESLFCSLVDKVTVHKEILIFRFNNGMEMEYGIE